MLVWHHLFDNKKQTVWCIYCPLTNFLQWISRILTLGSYNFLHDFVQKVKNTDYILFWQTPTNEHWWIVSCTNSFLRRATSKLWYWLDRKKHLFSWIYILSTLSPLVFACVIYTLALNTNNVKRVCIKRAFLKNSKAKSRCEFLSYLPYSTGPNSALFGIGVERVDLGRVL